MPILVCPVLHTGDVPTSRHRKRTLKRHAPPPAATSHDPWIAPGRITLESLFEKANRYGTGLTGPRVLYHYTSWNAAEAIIGSQQFRATAHDCTNDPAEFASADATIIELAREAFARAHGPVSRRVLRLFIDHYDVFRIGASRRAYLVCFSTSRDDPNQWCRYGCRGEGVCLGLRLLGADSPIIPGVSTTFMPVNYGTESELRSKIESWLAAFVSACDRAEDIEHNWRLAIDALNVSAAAWALTTKHLDWASEREVRVIYLAHEGSRITPIEEPRPGGSIRRYFPMRVTKRHRMPVQELIIGPNYDPDAGRARALQMFESARYRNPDRKASASTATLACV